MNPHFVRRQACPCCEGVDLDLLREAPYDAEPIRDYLDAFYRDVGGVEHAYLAGAQYVLMACRACGVVFQRDIPNDALMERLYEHWMDPAKVFEICERPRGVRAYTFLARQVEAMVRHFGRAPSGLKVLDFGMGWGHWCAFAQAYGCETYGLEISRARIDYASARGIRVLPYDELPDHDFDYINAEQVFEHVPTPLETLRMLAGRLRPDGIMWLSVPDGGDIRDRLAKWNWAAPKGEPDSLNAVAPLEHINCYDHASLVAMAGRAGLKPVSLNRPAARRAAGQARRSLWERLRGPATASPEKPSTELHFGKA